MIVVFVLSIILNCNLVSAQSYFLPLEGTHRFSPGDNPQWALPQYDDSHWKQIKVPDDWSSQWINLENGIGWYRIRFTASAWLKDIQPALFLGRIANADEVFFNGIKIGGEGIIGKRFVDAVKMTRLYKIPPELINYESPNIIAVKVINLYAEGGLIEEDFGIGDYRDLLVKKLKQDSLRKTVTIVFLTFLITFFLIIVLAYLKGLKNKEYIYSGFFIFSWMLLYVFDSLIWYEAGLKSLLIQAAINALCFLIPITLLLVIINVFGVWLNRGLRLFIICSLVLAGITLFFSTKSFAFDYLLYFLWMIQLLFIIVIGMSLTIRAYIRKHPESGVFLIGNSGLLLVPFIEIMRCFCVESFHIFLWWEDMVVIFFAFCILYVLIARHLRLSEGVKVLSTKILTAQEDEKKKLAMELHDGLGQNLLAIKFNLQRVNEKLDNPLVKDVIGEMSGSINELRSISQGLAPFYLDEMGIGQGINLYARNLSESTKIKVEVAGDTSLRLSPFVQINLFRIFQEILTNIAKHSEASEVKINLTKAGERVIMEIKDDGKGFDYDQKLGHNQGMGLSTIKERVNLINGILMIKSSKGEGTTVKVEVAVR